MLGLSELMDVTSENKDEAAQRVKPLQDELRPATEQISGKIKSQAEDLRKELDAQKSRLLSEK
eukprot:8408081-Pyramimonas_sp.AAC.1